MHENIYNYTLYELQTKKKKKNLSKNCIVKKNAQKLTMLEKVK